MSNDRDQEIVKSAIADTGSGLLEFLTALGQREAIAFGDGVTLPVRIRFDELPKHCMPRSLSARFTEKWQRSVGDEGFVEAIVDRWRNASSGSLGDPMASPEQTAEIAAAPAVGPDPGVVSEPPRREPAPIRREPPAVPATASGSQLGSALRALRDRLPQR